jgi:hypothetical protein
MWGQQRALPSVLQTVFSGGLPSFAPLPRFMHAIMCSEPNWGLPPRKSHANGALPVGEYVIIDRPSGRSSVVEHDLAKVGVEGSNPFARSSGSIHSCR